MFATQKVKMSDTQLISAMKLSMNINLQLCKIVSGILLRVSVGQSIYLNTLLFANGV